ncbi:lysosomal cobalamin transporter ABCD4 isoform X2 [Lithobates pipiens]
MAALCSGDTSGSVQPSLREVPLIRMGKRSVRTDRGDRPRLDWIFVRRFLALQSVLFPQWTARNTLMMMTLLIVALTGQLVIYQVGILPSQFYGILSDRDLTSFRSLAVVAVALILLISMLRSAEQYISKLVYVNCRKVMTQYLHQIYFTKQVYYTMSVEHSHVDNPDQRMTQDVERLCRELTGFASKILTTPFTLVYYSYQCSLSTGWMGPVSIFGYFVVGSLVNKLLMGPVIPRLVEQEKLEGDFRFKHVQIRVNAEAAAFARIGELVEVMMKIVQEDKDLSSEEEDDGSLQEKPQNGDGVIILDNVTISMPASECTLVRDLSLRVSKGNNLLISGETGSGKSSILRVLAGLWKTKHGRVSVLTPFGPHGILFLPQKSFLSDGSLREQVIYPLKEIYPNSGRMDDDRILRSLEMSGLTSLVSRTGGLDQAVDWNWPEVLSPGEIQRLAFSRLFYLQPKFAVLDEASSALSEDAEAELYTHCTQMGMTLISVGHRRSLQEFHHLELSLGPGGQWELRRLKKS